MTICPACGAPVEEGASACPACGAELEGSTQSFPVVGTEAPQGVPAAIDAEGPQLVVHKGRDVGERFFVDRSPLTIGRDPHSDIFLNDVTVSRNHAVLEMVDAEVSIEDAGSLNGTYVNGVCVDRAALENGDLIQVGTFQMIFFASRGDQQL